MPKWIGKKKVKPPVKPNQEPGWMQAEFTPLDRPADVLEKAEVAEPTAGAVSGADLQKCPACGLLLRDLEKHYLRKPDCQEIARKLEGETIVEVFPTQVGIFLVRTAVNLLKQRWPDRFQVVPSGDWLERSGELHTRVLNRYLGRRLQQNADVIMLVIAWGEFVAANQLYTAEHAASDDARDRAARNGKDAAGSASNIQ